ncbi:MAG: hypothetical protein JWM89_1584, partial [Acidimicrobiales bacterium]|nr:hypothetical protein [Acidimicrobiales bacterium]
MAALVISCGTALAAGAGAASASPNQAEPGLGTTAAASQQLATTSTTTVPSGGGASAAQADATQPAAGTPTISVAGSDHRLLTEDRKILIIVGALIFVAVALTLLTIRYWRQTRPARIAALAPAPRHLAGGVAPLPEPHADPSATAEHSVLAGTAGPPAGP